MPMLHEGDAGMQMMTRIRLSSFFANYPTRNYHRGQILLHPEDSVDKIIYMQSGRVRQYQISDDGNDVVVNVFRETTLFPISSILTKADNNYFFEASDDIKVRIAPIEDLRSFFNNNPDIVYDLLLLAHESIESILRRMSYAMSSSAYNRLLYELVNECLHTKKSNDTKQYNLKIHEYELAEQTGLSRETTNRVLKKMKQKGFVSVSRKFITVKNYMLLKNELGNHI